MPGTSVTPTPAGMRGRPVVLAFVEAFGQSDPTEDDHRALRAELRALGAVLVVSSRDGLYCVRTEGAPERLPGASIDSALPDTPRPALFVVDARGDVRFAASTLAKTPLGDALASARRALLREEDRVAKPPLLTRRECVAASLATSFVLTLLDGHGGARPQRLRAVACVEARVRDRALGKLH
jgi:hypothetical protein